MFCFSCGKQIRDDAKFCPFCGESAAEQETDGGGFQVGAYNAGTPDFGSAKDAEVRALAAVRKAEQKKRGKRAALIIIIVVVICALAFVLYFGPKYMNIRLLPFDLLGVFGGAAVSDETPATGVDAGEGKDLPDGGAAEDGADVGAAPDDAALVPGEGRSRIVLTGDTYRLEATIGWSMAEDGENMAIEADGQYTTDEGGEVSFNISTDIESGESLDIVLRMMEALVHSGSNRDISGR